MTITVRRAKPYDVANLCRLLDQAYEDSGGIYPEVHEPSMLVWVSNTLTSGYTIVAEKSGRIVGSLALTDFQFPWNPRYYLTMEWFYVTRGFRDNGTADALIKAAHAFADEGKMPILAGLTSAKDPELKDRLMRMKGYTYLGGTFMRMEHGLEIRKENGQGHEAEVGERGVSVSAE
jgi:predicted N-acetyltransferase YhbS